MAKKPYTIFRPGQKVWVEINGFEKAIEKHYGGYGPFVVTEVVPAQACTCGYVGEHHRNCGVRHQYPHPQRVKFAANGGEHWLNGSALSPDTNDGATVTP